MGILNALGLMTKAEHDKAVLTIERERDKFRDQVRDTCARAEKAEALLKDADSRVSAAVRERDAAMRDSTAANDKFKKAVTDLAAAQEEIDRLKPLAEATERRRANDAKRVRPSRAKAKVASETVKTGAATGKPRTAIPAKVGGGSAKLSGDRPAKKASGK